MSGQATERCILWLDELPNNRYTCAYVIITYSSR
jgi:hypothetical protein